MANKRHDTSKSFIKVNDYTLVQIDEDLIRSILREEIAKMNNHNTALVSQAIFEIRRVGTKIEAGSACCLS